MINRDNVRAYIDCNVKGKVFLEEFGYRNQMIVGSWQDVDGWISLGIRGHRGPYVHIGDGPRYDLEFMCDARQKPERLANDEKCAPRQ